MLKSDLDLLKHILDETNFILNNTNTKSLETILDDEILCRAIIRSLEIIGEASKKLTPDFKAGHPVIEWRKMAATRDRLIHDYFGIDYDIVWDIIINKLSLLKNERIFILNAESRNL